MEILKKYRKSKKMTYEEMAEFLDVSKSFYEKLELGIRKPSQNFLQKVKRKIPDIDMNIFFD